MGEERFIVNYVKTYEIQSARLKVVMAYPNTVYTGSRFDWSGFITQVYLDNKHTYCAYESTIPGFGTGGIGICNAFDALGYEEAAVGEWFSKPGVGLLKKYEEAPYFFAKNYEIDPFEMTVTATSSSITFTTHPKDVNGYAYLLSKHIEVNENNMVIRYEMKNVGQKTIQIEEFTHNFLCLDNQVISEDYALGLSFEPSFEKECGNPILKDHCIQWPDAPKDDFFGHLYGFGDKVDQSWKLSLISSKTSVTEICHFPIKTFNFWGTPTVVSPEAFIGLTISPNETKKWQRTYVFE